MLYKYHGYGYYMVTCCASVRKKNNWLNFKFATDALQRSNYCRFSSTLQGVSLNIFVVQQTIFSINFSSISTQDYIFIRKWNLYAEETAVTVIFCYRMSRCIFLWFSKFINSVLFRHKTTYSLEIWNLYISMYIFVSQQPTKLTISNLKYVAEINVINAFSKFQ